MRSGVIYVRVSSSRQVENYSLDVQEDACRAFCREQGWPVARTFREEGESARSADRTQLTALMDFCRENRALIAAVVVHSISRWSRDTRDHYRLTGLLNGWGIRLVSATEPMIDDSPEGEMMEAMFAGWARYENRQRTRRTTGGMRKALESGRWVFRAPLGYLSGGRGARGGPSLIANPATADLVRTCFELFVSECLAEHVVQRRLTERGFMMPDGQPVSRQTVSKILRNAAYAGRVALPAWGITVRGDWEPLISGALFDLAQARLAGHGAPKVHAREHEDFTLRGFIRCGACDKPLTGAWSKGRGGKRYGHYWCWHCRPAVRVSKPVLEGLFVDLLARLQPQVEQLSQYAAAVREVWGRREGAVRDDRARLNQRIDALRAKRDRIADLLADGTLDAPTYQRQRDRLDQDLALAEDALQNTVTDHLDVERILGFAEGVLTDASRVWERVTAPQRRLLQATLFADGVVYEPPKLVRGRQIATKVASGAEGARGSLRTGSICLAFNRFASVPGHAIGDGSATGIRTPV